MYVASLSVVVGWATLFGAAVLLAYAVALFVFFTLFVRLYEEPRLRREFGRRIRDVRLAGRPLAAPPAAPQQGHLTGRAGNLEGRTPSARRLFPGYARALGRAATEGARQASMRDQNIAMGLAGLPVPRATFRGRAMNMKA